MTGMPFIGAIFFAVGVLIAVFHRSVGIAFCKIGKYMWKNNPLGISPDYTDKFYDERKAPRIMFLMGVVLAVEGVIFWFFPKFIQ